MRTKTINLYLFDELTEELKDKVIREYCDINVEDNFWNEFIIQEKKESLLKLGFVDSEILFSGFCSQGDGASFTATLDLETWVKETGYKASPKLMKSIREGEVTASIERTSSHYSHENTCTVYLEDTLSTEWKTLSAELWELEEAIEENRIELCEDIYKTLRTQYYSLINDDAVQETLKANEYYFNEQGKIENV